MARGGRRAGAGRKPGSATQKTRTIANLAASTGLTPLEVMLDAMRFFHDVARDEIALGPEMRLGKVAEALAAAGEHAKNAAPYMHPKLAPIQPQGGDTAEDAARKIREAAEQAKAIEEAE